MRDIDSGDVTSCSDHDGYESIASGLYIMSKAEILVGHNIISIDFKLRTQYNKGLSPRNRGTAFRINDKNLDKLFDREIIR